VSHGNLCVKFPPPNRVALDSAAIPANAPLFGGATAPSFTVRDSWWAEFAALNLQPRRG
jgi:hypothetical protein